MRISLTCLILILFSSSIDLTLARCTGRFVNPITDISWSCLFPITICGVRVSPGNEDTGNPRSVICTCGSPIPRIGLPISFWEPARLIDVTREKFCMVNMGGIKLGGGGARGHGTVNNKHTPGHKTSFYQVHYYVYPVLYWLELLTDFVCMERAQFDVAYMTEFDPLWNDDETAFILSPEAVAFANPIAQATCAADCIAATSGFPVDALFWCSGCQGSIYPYTGNVADHVSGVQASLLLVSRMLAKMHKSLIAQGTIGQQGMCGPYLMPVMMKSQYKQQMLYPSSTTGRGGCKPLGRSDLLWSSGKEKPNEGEDFGYLIWRKRNCCLL